MRDKLHAILGDRIWGFLRSLRDWFLFLHIYLKDMWRYMRDSTVLRIDTYHKVEAQITLNYHGLEKGFLHRDIRPYFARQRVINLLRLLHRKCVSDHWDDSHIQSALSILCHYYEWHTENGYELEYFSEVQYECLREHLNKEFNAFKVISKTEFLSSNNLLYPDFAASRSSIREFTGEIIPKSILNEVVRLANLAPSACNRQGVVCTVLENKPLIDKVLDLQGGLKGYTKSVNQLIVLSADRNYYYTPGERHQLYVDGGIYLMSLLYALHFYGIAACTAHWSMPPQADDKLAKWLSFPRSRQVVCLVAIGYPNDEVRATESHRRSPEENLEFI